ncbi:hypothetical protein F441_11649 [Phytophthora nicotianae CJ01A1]|uniref:Uncharacterized protein n=6 Tax=Phytophthora nicotianae TaxID=4792 RepID=W2Q333_PHYN3|nr:hypothetical protein PPTG_12914 [Phytophthora nicotianae INRA-310]ETI43282.1 hypothetical protein F443_11715 [Phytophthora nicotianae P1569]ETK83350.1 hypothetical protein L915_11405 [Phytophthora nicotianae]ETO71933.1 hypothetical protein F444_11799 [Phytophthora nicotianae P1976]ETP13065.1 hypothetical protein F441_11649 [Phytophthora nicotianae CJ01A1]ETP41154.1 hypothetical protein F442_11617 [Phytophthora nicotianae P10297]KUF92560.1 hypothetical protein AM587_10011012 [Phytophthora n
MEQEKPKASTTSGGRELALPSTFSSLTAAASNKISALARVPSMEDSVKFSGGAVAAVLALRYAGSLRSACMMGLLSGLFAHSLYADVLRKKRRRRSKRQDDNEETDTDSS